MCLNESSCMRYWLPIWPTFESITNLIFDEKTPAPHVLILINPYREHEYLIEKKSQRKVIAEQLMSFAIPTLDIISSDGHPLALADAQKRIQFNGVKPSKYYRQYKLNLDLSNESGWEEAASIIEGFMRKHSGK